MNNSVRYLVEESWNTFQSMPPDQRLLLGIAGIPGSGKTTLARILTHQLNARAASVGFSCLPAIYVPMDGFHLSRAELDAMPDPAYAHARRGAAFTFDASKFLSLVQALRAPLPPGSPPILAPSFDHAVKDPKEDDIAVMPTHRIVILEGNYLALDEPVWRDIGPLMDKLWFVEVDFEVARKRLRERHVRAGIAKDIVEGDLRAVKNDLVNGEQIDLRRVKLDQVLISQEDSSWAHM